MSTDWQVGSVEPNHPRLVPDIADTGDLHSKVFDYMTTVDNDHSYATLREIKHDESYDERDTDSDSDSDTDTDDEIYQSRRRTNGSPKQRFRPSVPIRSPP